MQVRLRSGFGISCRKDFPGSCSTFLNAWARSGESRSASESCSVVMGDSSGDGMKGLGGSDFEDDLELSSSEEIVVGFSLVGKSSLGAVTCC